MITAHAYPWDVIGDEAFLGRAGDLDLDGVVLAAAYHTVRAATAGHPRHAFVSAPRAALYRPVRESAWASHRLVPAEAPWAGSTDSVAEATAALHAAGLPVTAWIVLTHSSHLGAAHPELAVVNCFGEPYPYALCPSHEDVRGYAATLAAEAVRDLPLAGVVLEACGQLGVEHGGHHDKTAGAYGPMARWLLSVCCCAGCARGWAGHGLDATETRALLRAAVAALGSAGEPRRGWAPGQGDGMGQRDEAEQGDGMEQVPDAVARALLAVRHENTGALRAAVIGALPGMRITLHADPDPWATGAMPGLPPGGCDEVDAVVVRCWETDRAAAERVRRARSLLPDQVRAGAYVSVLPPVTADDVPGHIRTLIAAGADEVHLYHLGLAGPRRHRLLRDAVKTFKEESG